MQQNLFSRIISITVAASLGIFPVLSYAETNESETDSAPVHLLTLQEYLQQVENGNEGYRAAHDADSAANMYVTEAQIALMPTLFSSLARIEDRKPQPPFSITYDKVVQNQFQAGVSQQTDFGLLAKASYTWTESHYSGFVGFPGFPIASDFDYFEGHPLLELTMPLWRNWMGGETKNQITAAEAQTQLEQNSNRYQAQQIQYAAESNYWRLALAREGVKVAREAFARAGQIDVWMRRRANLDLTDRSDYLQSQASVKSHRLDLLLRQDEERSASIAFNASRGLAQTSVPETLEPFSPERLAQLKIPERKSERGDVAVARSQAKVATATSILAIQKDQPTLELFGSLAYNSLDYKDTDAFQQSLAPLRVSDTIGIRLNAPLDFSTLSRARQGRSLQAQAAEMTLRRKIFEQDRDWDDLVQKFGEAQDRLSLYLDLEKTQKEKFLHERDRQSRGRTTTQQVLLFEIDLENAQLARISTLNELNQLYAQMKLFGGLK